MKFIYLAGSIAFALFCAGPSYAKSELALRKSIVETVKQSFLKEDFARLEELSDRYRREKTRTYSGTWRLSSLYWALSGLISEQEDELGRDESFRKLNKLISKWEQQFPDSPAVHIVRSNLLISHAWEFRGGGYARDVKPEAWPPFRKYIALARKNLEDHTATASRDPDWYRTMLTIARAQNWSHAEFNDLLNEAIEKEPLYYETYFSALQYLLPKWHGDIAAIEAFARNAVKHTSHLDGQGLYARIYWYASQAQFENNIFHQSAAVWTHMKNGFDDVIAQFPDAWNLNNYARFACLARDKETLKEVFIRMDTDFVVEAWSPASMIKACHNWAFDHYFEDT